MQKSRELNSSLDFLALLLGIGIIMALRAYAGDTGAHLAEALPEAAQHQPMVDETSGAVAAH